MHLQHNYYYYNSVISKFDCDKIINLGKSKIKALKDQGIDTTAVTFGDKQKDSNSNSKPLNDKNYNDLKQKGENSKDFYVRDSEICWLTEDWIYDLILPLVRQANINAGWNYEWSTPEQFQFTVYNSPGGFYGWHQDGGSDHHAIFKRYIHGVTNVPLRANGNIPMGYTNMDEYVGKIRKLSLTLNLNGSDEYEGGNLMFDMGKHNEEQNQFYECTEIREKGSLIVFPRYLQHCVTPVTKGTRYSRVLWCLGEAFK